MIKVSVCMASAHKDVYKNKLQKFTKGIEMLNDSVVTENYPSPEHYDTAVIYGSYKKYRGSLHHKIKCQVAEKFKNYVQLETPVIGRSASTIDHDYLRVGVGGFLWDQAEWGFAYTDPDRYKKVFNDLGYNTNQEWKTKGSKILILLQNPGDASLRGTDIYNWCYDTITELQKHTDRPIVVRPHPLPRKGFDRFTNTIQMFDNVTMVENCLPDRLRPLQLDFEDCYCAVSYASGSAVDAVLAGVPSLTNDPGNMAWLVSRNQIADIENRYLGDRVDWMQKVAMCQWSVQEFESGKCWDHVSKSI